MYDESRKFLKALPWSEVSSVKSDQELGKTEPSVFKGYNKDKLIKLKKFEELKIKEKSFSEIIVSRRSVRKYSDKVMTLDELSYLVYTNNGITAQTNNKYLRSSPSGGNRQTIETYLIVQNIEGLAKGLYRYIPLENAIIFEKDIENIEDVASTASRDQKWMKKSGVVFVWTTTPYRLCFPDIFLIL